MSIVLYLRRATEPEMMAMLADLDRLDEDYFDVADDGDLIDFDVYWHAVHCMLTGSEGATDDPLSLLIDGSPAVGGRGMGFVEYWLIPPKQMKSFADALDAVSDETLGRRYDLAGMLAAGIYGDDALEQDSADGVRPPDALLRHLAVLRSFASRCRDAGCGAIKCFS